jgi:hypothetical protein
MVAALELTADVMILFVPLPIVIQSTFPLKRFDINRGASTDLIEKLLYFVSLVLGYFR